MSKKLKVGDLVKIKNDHMVRVKKSGKYKYYIPPAGLIVEIKEDKAIVMWMETNDPELNFMSMKVHDYEHNLYFLDSLVLYKPYLKRISSKKYLSSLQQK